MSDVDPSPEITTTHYQRADENLALFSGENLHFVGYFENQEDTLETAFFNLNRFFLRMAGITATDLVLDVGCGIGGPACYFAEMTGCKVVGIDIGEHQIQRAHKLAEAKNLPSLVNFFRQNATQMAFKAQQFDVILMMGSASNIQMKDKLFLECARVIKPRGRLVLGDAIVVDPAWLHDPKNAFKLSVCRTFFGNPYIASLDSYRDLLQDHQFQIIEEQDLSPHMLRSLTLWATLLESQKAAFVRQLGDRQYRAFTRGVQIITEVAHSGPISCAIITAIKQMERLAS